MVGRVDSDPWAGPGRAVRAAATRWTGGTAGPNPPSARVRVGVLLRYSHSMSTGQVLRAVAAAAGVLLATALSACATDHSRTVPALERERVAEDQLPSSWDAELSNQHALPATSRLLGSDSAGYEYFVTELRGGGYCLIVMAPENPVNPHDTWRAGCSPGLPLEVGFSGIGFDGVTATLIPHGESYEEDDDVEVIAEQVLVRR